MNRLIKHHGVILYTLLGMNRLVGLFISGVDSGLSMLTLKKLRSG